MSYSKHYEGWTEGVDTSVFTQIVSKAAAVQDSREGQLWISGNAIGAATPIIGLDVALPAQPTFDAPEKPVTFTPSPLEFGDAPNLVAPGELGAFTLPPAPTEDFGAMPGDPRQFYGVAPEMTDTVNIPTVPDAPTITIPAYPDLVGITLPTFSGVAPEYDPTAWEADFTLVEPNVTPYTYEEDPLVAEMRDRRAWLLNRIQVGGTGLPVDVENAIWARDRDRVNAAALTAERDAATADAAQGFMIPGGALQAKISAIRMDALGKVVASSRDIAIRQAEMEIDNINKSIEFVTQLEGKLADAVMNGQRIKLDAAKYATDAAVAVYDARIKGYLATVEVKKVGAQVYAAMIDAFKARVEAYRALIDGERAKSDMNRGLVEMFSAQIKAEQTRMEIYRVEVEALSAVAKLEEFKIRKFEAEINAFTAGVNAYTAELSGNKIQAEIYGEKVRAYQAKVSAYSSEVDAQGKYYTATIEGRRALLLANEAEINAYKARVEAAGVKAKAEAEYASAYNTAQSTYAQAISSHNQVLANVWNASMQAVMSQRTLAMENAKINAEIQRSAQVQFTELAKTSAQVNAQLIAAKTNMVSVHRNINSSQGLNENHNHNFNETT